MITAEIIRRIAPRARQDYADALVNGKETLDQWGINTPLRLSAFLATICHETGGLTIVRESGNYSASRIRAVWPTRPEAVKHAGNARGLFNSVYGGRMGNERNGTNDDDGYRYRGGGMIQLTGRDSYERAGKAIGIDLGADPELIEDASISLKAACWEFAQHLKYCDMGERGWKAVCNAINRGNALSKLDPIGWHDRQIWYSRCCDAFGVTGKIDDDLLRLGDQGPLVKAYQERLASLFYPIGRADGIFGSRTRAAVLAFQAENDLQIDGVLGPETRNCLNSENAKPMPLGERANETIEDLKEAGSKQVEAAQAVKTGSKAVAVTSAVVGVAQSVTEQPTASTDLIKGTKDVVTEISSWKAITSLVGDTFLWATSHWWVFAIVLAFIIYRWGRQIELRRLWEHQTGMNLSR